MRDRTSWRIESDLADTQPSRRRSRQAEGDNRAQLEMLLHLARTSPRADEAMEYVQRAVSLRPDDPRVQSTVHLTVGLMLLCFSQAMIYLSAPSHSLRSLEGQSMMQRAEAARQTDIEGTYASESQLGLQRSAVVMALLLIGLFASLWPPPGKLPWWYSLLPQPPPPAAPVIATFAPLIVPSPVPELPVIAPTLAAPTALPTTLPVPTIAATPLPTLPVPTLPAIRTLVPTTGPAPTP